MKKYRVLLITDFSKPWNNGWYCKAGFEKNGHKVLTLDPSKENNSAAAIKDLISKEKPDLILHTKDEFPPEVFSELKKMTRVVMWYPDPVIPDWLPEYVKASHIFLTMSEGLVDEFKAYNPRVFWLSQAFEPSFFEINEITSEDKAVYSADAAFVGNLGSKSQYIARRTALQRVASSGIDFKWWGPKIPRKLSTILLISGKLGRSYGGRFVWGQEYAKVARLSKIFLAFDSMPHIRKSMSARMYTAVGCGAFYMCRHVDGIEDVLVPDREIVTFHSDDEMMDKIGFYLKNDSLRQKIAKTGRERVLKEHTYETRIKQMINIVNESI